MTTPGGGAESAAKAAEVAAKREPAVYRRAARGEVWRGITSVPLLAAVTILTAITFVDAMRSDWLPSSASLSWDGQMGKGEVGVILVVCFFILSAMGWPSTVARLRLRSSLRTWSPGSVPSLRGTVTGRRRFRVIVDGAIPGSADAPLRRVTLPRDSRRVQELRPGDPVLVEGVIRPGAWVAVTTPNGVAWVRLLPRRGWRLTSM